MKFKSAIDPYRVFFPLGILASIIGTFPWITFGFGTSHFYPIQFHPDLMIGGFLFAFISGFLMTAIPQFTGSDRCKKSELFLRALLFACLIGSSFHNDHTWFYLLSLLSLIFLVLFCARRFLKRTYEPPRFFVFVGLGLLMGIVGSLLLALTYFASFAKLIYTQGMTLSLVLGVGTHLLPAIWGWSDLPIQITKLDEHPNPLKMIAPVIALAVILVVSFFIEARGLPQIGLGLRATLVTYLAVSQWKILRRPKARGKIAFWLWIAAWFLLLGLWTPIVFPEYRVHALHIAFIGGFGLMTLMVASRVTLAHGGYGHFYDLRSRLLTAAAVLILGAALTRAIAAMMPNLYLHHLGYAAGIWILAVILWSTVFVPKMIRIKST